MPIAGQQITGDAIKYLAIEKYRSIRNAITFNDLQRKFSLKKAHVKGSLKQFHKGRILFTAGDLNSHEK
jgi:hypothetical protein